MSINLTRRKGIVVKKIVNTLRMQVIWSTRFRNSMEAPEEAPPDSVPQNKAPNFVVDALTTGKLSV